MTGPAPAAPEHSGRRRRQRRALVSGLVLLAVLAAAALLLARDGPRAGSGSAAAGAEVRALPPFTAVELAGTNRVAIRVGTPQRVVVQADRSVLGKVLTRVRSGVLTVSDRGVLTSRSPMTVVVSVPSLRAATLSGTGELTVSGVAAPGFTAELSGTGTLTASGRADRVSATLSGDGALALAALHAREVTVTVPGTGTAAVRASASLTATLAGTGAIVYGGDPARVASSVTGTGTITSG